MSLMTALLETYDFAIENGLVDNIRLSQSGSVILPIYHSSRVCGNEDVFEITIDKNSNAIGGSFLRKDEIVIFPITEESIIRSGTKKAPHAIGDELSYLGKDIDPKKNEKYLKGIEELLDYEETHNNENYRVMGEYILKNTILEDFYRFFLGGIEHSINDKYILTYEEVDKKGKVKKKSIDLKKIFITFKLEKRDAGNITLTGDTGLHDFYIGYVRDRNARSAELSYCDITGKLDYCITRHRGLMGTAKLIGISNHNETYYGRIKDGKDICSVSYEASQKIHNMLKYLIENKNYSSYIGEGAYLINWLSHDLEKGGVELVSKREDDDDEDFGGDEEVSMDALGGEVSRKLKKFFIGQDARFGAERDFHVLIIEKINDGRLSIKYYRMLSRSEAYERVMNWYKTINWRFFKAIRSPSLYEIVNFVYGLENSQGYLSCENKKLSRSTIERLIPCIIDGQRLPRDISKTAFYKLSKKRSYKKSWNRALETGCALIKKTKNDYEKYVIDPNKISEVKQLTDSRSFYYGKLMAIYEKIELDAVMGRDSNATSKEEKSTYQRVTNADKLWSSIIRTPERTRFVLETKIKPYLNILKKNNPGFYVFYDKLITGISTELMNLDEAKAKRTGSLDENFILGYYYQKNAFYQKKDKNAKKNEDGDSIIEANTAEKSSK